MPSRLTVVLLSLLLALPVVIFWLWLVIVPARVAILCPEGCRCDIDGIIIKCVNTPINEVLLNNLAVYRDISLFDYNITLLKKDSFVSRTELVILDINGCGRRTRELGAFNGLTNLMWLSISYNEISEIIPGTFQNMISLVYLYLNRN
jgi:hypothetical protein